MDKTAYMRGSIIRHLKNSRAFSSVVTAEAISGNHFSATEIAVKDIFGRLAVYRLILIRHG